MPIISLMDILSLLFPKKCLECASPGKYICHDCIQKVRSGNSYSYSSLSVFKYEGVVRKAIMALKYKYSTDIAEELVDLTIQRLKDLKFPKNTVLVPIPIHKRKRMVRGFNQTEILGEKLASALKLDYERDLLVKTKTTKPQVGLKGDVRRRNLEGSFNINSEVDPKKYKNILIFDDVYTTGSTLNEARKVLKEGGVENTYFLTIAR